MKMFYILFILIGFSSGEETCCANLAPKNWIFETSGIRNASEIFEVQDCENAKIYCKSTHQNAIYFWDGNRDIKYNYEFEMETDGTFFVSSLPLQCINSTWQFTPYDNSSNTIPLKHVICGHSPQYEIEDSLNSTEV
ncbi:unnamed protein product [Caenorhabditis angaria]|uniref:Uncharacterized protein n=1 Tax=Caenorhabditis angaria TaxID=860376 RepID=A0A9P1MX22_9PELO|nr:unnamed protein product [Caenorhabditis angaria]